MDDVQKAREAVCEAVATHRGSSSPMTTALAITAALDAYAEAVRRRTLEEAAAKWDADGTDDWCPATAVPSWLRSLARPTEEGR